MCVRVTVYVFMHECFIHQSCLVLSSIVSSRIGLIGRHGDVAVAGRGV